LELQLERLHKSEQAAYLLRGIYEQYGYRKYRMGKFEEYDFYTEHKDFLPSGQILTFTDLDGKLMALKPDVTMSIVKRTRATKAAPERLYYSESIYRPSREAHEYREIAQIGVEYIGRVTAHTDAELVTLALKSLACIEDDFILDVSHNGFLSGLFESVNASREAKRDILRCIETKNRHELAALLLAHGIDAAQGESLSALLSLGGGGGMRDDGNSMSGRRGGNGGNNVGDGNGMSGGNGLAGAMAEVRRLAVNGPMRAAADELAALFDVFDGDPLAKSLRLDFSLALDSAYYNGLMFRGYVRSAPRAVLSGGRYDPLLRRMGVADLEAIGFAVYLDEVEASLPQPMCSDCDAVVLYPEHASPALLRRAVEGLITKGLRVRAQAIGDADGTEAARVVYDLAADGTLVEKPRPYGGTHD
jgi:ATP phosphoribosyltransferase regulatory subunit